MLRRGSRITVDKSEAILLGTAHHQLRSAAYAPVIDVAGVKSRLT